MPGADPEYLDMCGRPMRMGGARALAWLIPIFSAIALALYIRSDPDKILTPTLRRHHNFLLCNLVLFVIACIMCMWATVYNVNDKVRAKINFGGHR